MFGDVTTLEGLHVTGKYRDRSKQHTCSRHAAWDLHTGVRSEGARELGKGGQKCEAVPRRARI